MVCATVRIVFDCRRFVCREREDALVRFGILHRRFSAVSVFWDILLILWNYNNTGILILCSDSFVFRQQCRIYGTVRQECVQSHFKFI